MTTEILNELEQIHLLLKSPDIETRKLGKTLFFKSSFIEQYKGKLNKLCFKNPWVWTSSGLIQSYKWYQYNLYELKMLVYGLLNNEVTVFIKTN